MKRLPSCSISFSVTRARSAPTAKQRLSAIRHLFACGRPVDWLVVGQVMPANPAASLRGPSHAVKRGKMAGWIKPAALRLRMITGILQLNANFVFCFRAKEKIKPRPGGGIQELGFMPIAGEELLFEMTVNCLLMPKSNGVPTSRSD